MRTKDKNETRIKDLTKWGFKRLSSTEFSRGQYFCVSLMNRFAIFSTTRFTEPVAYDKLREFLINNGYKETTGQESIQETND